MYLSAKVVVVYSSGETRLKTKYEKCVKKIPKLFTLVYLISGILANLGPILYVSVDSLYFIIL